MPVRAPFVMPEAPSDRDRTSQLDIAGELTALLRSTTTEPRPDMQLEALTLAVAADLPVLLWGEPGIGKTAALTQLAACTGPVRVPYGTRRPRVPDRGCGSVRASGRRSWASRSVGGHALALAGQYVYGLPGVRREGVGGGTSVGSCSVRTMMSPLVCPATVAASAWSRAACCKASATTRAAATVPPWPVR